MINLEEKIKEYFQKKIYLSPHPLNRASEAGHPCLRYLVLSRTKNELKVLPDVNLQAIFEEGNIHEAAELRILQEAGFRIIEQQRAFEWKEKELSGHIDAIVIGEDGKRYPLEIKSCSPNVFRVIQKSEALDLIHARQHWLQKYPAQIILYMLMGNYEEGVLWFKEKVSGKRKQLNISLNDPAVLEYGEQILKRLEKVNGMIKRGEEPPVGRIDACAGCPFEKTVCFPGLDFGEGADILDDSELLEKLDRLEELRDGKEEYDAIWSELKEKFQGKSAIIGAKWIVESKKQVRTEYQIPQDVKKQYATQKEIWVLNVQKL